MFCCQKWFLETPEITLYTPLCISTLKPLIQCTYHLSHFSCWFAVLLAHLIAYIYEYTSSHAHGLPLQQLLSFYANSSKIPFIHLFAFFFKAKHWSINLACLIFLCAYWTKILECGRNKTPLHFGSWALYFQYSSSRSFLSLCANNLSVSVKL